MTTDLKHTTPATILWLDLEMTGLDASKDRILEVAAIVTDWDFKEKEVFTSGIGGELDRVKELLDANAWFKNFPENKTAFLALCEESPSLAEVEDKLIALLDAHVPDGELALLAGNSIHKDREFIRHWLPRLDARLHYRLLDVSAWKVVMQGKYNIEFKKSETHRAIDDVRESIAELEFYLANKV